MRRMFQCLRLVFLTSGMLAVLLAACSPSLNWRQVRLPSENKADATQPAPVLQALLPCKPDKATRRQSMAGYDVQMTMLGCEAGHGDEHGLFIVAVADVASRAAVPAVMAQWQVHLLAATHAQGGTRKAFAVKGADAQPEGTQLLARGRRSQTGNVSDDVQEKPGEGSSAAPEMMVQAVWFARGNRLYHAAVYAEHLKQEMTEPFFSNLAFE